MAVRDDDPIDATLEGAPILDDTGESSEVLWASNEGPAADRGPPTHATLADMPPLAAPPTVPRGPPPSPPRLSAPPTQRAAATVVARLSDVIGSDGISFDASEADGEASGFEDGATRPELARHEPPAPPPAPRLRPAEPPPDFDELAPAPPPTTLPPTTLPPMRPAMARPTRGGGPGSGADLPTPPSTSPGSGPRRETRGPMPGVGLPGSALDPPVPPPPTTKRAEPRGPVAGVGGLDPPLPPPPTKRPPTRRERPADDVAPVTAPPAVGGGRGGLPIVAAILAILIVVALTRGGAGSVAGGLDPRDARTLADRARAALAHKARSDVDEPVGGIARSIIGEGARVLVLRDKSGDAWLLPDGGVVVTDGLLRRLSSNAQLAAVMAHLTAHHALGHIGALALDLDGPAVLVASSASAGVDEDETDVRAAALLAKAGWRTRALVEVEDALGAGPWAARHKRRSAKIMEAVDTGGREDKDAYERQIRSRLGAP